MEFLVIVLFVVAIFLANLLVSRALRRRKQANGDSAVAGKAAGEPGQQHPQRAAKLQKSPRKPAGAKAAPAARTSAEAAREANARLDAVQHQQVYAAIAQGHPIKAVKLYAQFTGVGVRTAGAAIENLATHPQPFQPPRPAGQAPAAGPVQSPGPETAVPEKTAAPEQTPGPAADGEPAKQENKKQDGPAPSTGPAKQESKEQDGPGKTGPGKGTDAAGGAPSSAAATPEEDEISKWVKNLRPEDF